MVFRIITFCLILIVSWKSFGNDELKAIYDVDISFLEKLPDHSCLSKYYLSAMSGEFDASTVMDKCSQCRLSKTHKYNCYKIEYLSYFNKGEFSEAASSLINLSNDNELTQLFENSQFAAMNNQLAKKLMELNVGPQNIDATVELKDGYWTYQLPSGSWLFDTAASFGATNKNCKIRNFEKAMALGKLEDVGSCLVDIEHAKNYPLLANSDKDVLGHAFFSTFNKVKTSNTSTIPSTSEFYYDGKLLITRGSAKTKELNFNAVNMCIDTGSSKTVMMPRLHRKFRSELSNNEIGKVNAKTPFGSIETLAKNLKQVTLNIGSNEYKLIEVPMIIRNIGFYECDVLLGMDILKNLIDIDYKNFEITLAPEN